MNDHHHHHLVREQSTDPVMSRSNLFFSRSSSWLALVAFKPVWPIKVHKRLIEIAN